VNRRRFTAIAVGAGISLPLAAMELGRSEGNATADELPDRPLPVPSDGVVRVAVAIGPGTNMIDLAGPWEVFQDAAIARAAGRFDLTRGVV
jgi:hypothetical protein